jgi:hypothetical protein
LTYHGSRADHLLLRASHVEFCGVLYEEHDLLLRDPLPGGVDVWLKNLIESDLGIIEELIRGIRFQFPPAGCGNRILAVGRSPAQRGFASVACSDACL